LTFARKNLPPKYVAKYEIKYEEKYEGRDRVILTNAHPRLFTLLNLRTLKTNPKICEPITSMWKFKQLNIHRRKLAGIGYVGRSCSKTAQTGAWPTTHYSATMENAIHGQ